MRAWTSGSCRAGQRTLVPDGLAGQRRTTARQDLAGPELVVQLRDSGAGPGVDAVQDGRAQRVAVLVGGQQAADPEPGERPAAGGAQQVRDDGGEVGPPHGFGVVLHPAGAGRRHAVFADGPGEHGALGVHQDALRAGRADVHAEQQSGHPPLRRAAMREIDYHQAMVCPEHWQRLR